MSNTPNPAIIRLATLNPVIIRPVDLKPGDALGLKVIAVIGHNGDWAAYRGLTNWSDEEVAATGDKLPQEVAEMLFYAPTVLGLVYRR